MGLTYCDYTAALDDSSGVHVHAGQPYGASLEASVRLRCDVAENAEWRKNSGDWMTNASALDQIR